MVVLSETDRQLQKYVALELRRRELENELKRVEAESKKLGANLLDYFIEMGKQNETIQTTDGQKLTVYIHRQLWASAVDGNYEAACEALRESGYGEFVQPRFNTNQVSAIARELDKSGGLPAAWEGAIKVSEVFTLRTQKAG